MSKIMPFQRTTRLISDVDEFLDRCSDAIMVTEQTVLHYLERNDRESLEERLDQIRGIEQRADELRRSVANVMYSEMLMPDTREDVLSLLSAIDDVLDECTHLVARLVMERPELPDTYNADYAAVMQEASKAIQTMLGAARIYFKDPLAVRGEISKVHFHDEEGTNIVLRVGRQIFDSDHPLEIKRYLADWLGALRSLGSDAGDVADLLAILAVKRS